jgi:hypothetical protein
MKLGFAFCALSLFGGIVAQACGSDDGKKSNGPDYSAQGGDGAAGEPASATSGTGGKGGSASDAGAPTTGATAGAPSSADGGAGAAPPNGSAGEGAQANAGGQGGSTGEAGAGGAGEAITCELAPTCTGDLSSAGTGDFSIAFTLTTTATARSGVLSQRAICMHSKFWDVRMGPTAGGTAVSLELDDQTTYSSKSFVTPVNDGEPHELRFCRKSGQVHAFVDGALLGSFENTSNLASLAPVAVGTTHCMPYDGTVALVGTVADVCVGAL